MQRITEAAEDVVEVIEIVVAFLQHGFVADCVVDQSVRVRHCAGASKVNQWNEK